MVKRFVSELLEENTYVVELAGRVFVVDPGEGASSFVEQIAGKTRVTVLITHAHADHFCSLQNLNYDFLFLHRLEKVSLMSPEKHLGNYLDISSLDVKSHQICELDDLPSPWSYIHTPGHTPGSVCFDLKGDILFTGDTVFSDAIGRTDLPGGSDEKMRSTLTALKKHFAQNPHLNILPGHGPEATASKILVRNPYFRAL